MATCSRCNGSGTEVYEEDERICGCACYHCGGSGQVDAETAFADKLQAVAKSMGAKRAAEYRKACDEDPDGEGFEFRAAESMLTSWDYEKVLTYEYTATFAEKLQALPRNEQEEYVRKLNVNEEIENISLDD